MTIEGDRVASFGKLEDGLKQASPWYMWGPYVSERQWGTVREELERAEERVLNVDAARRIVRAARAVRGDLHGRLRGIVP